MIGSRLANYEITSRLGSGGMGEVYRARDAHLNRDVAVKILPERFSLDGERLARFKREAQLLASLNHPKIAAIYGFEESSGLQALVLELVEGSTLADRIAQGPVPLDEALAIAHQIAEALEAAHEHGIIHRDLKPANIKVREGHTCIHPHQRTGSECAARGHSPRHQKTVAPQPRERSEAATARHRRRAY
jgi:eukaryotic-like serine/threonine-protein kinase